MTKHTWSNEGSVSGFELEEESVAVSGLGAKDAGSTEAERDCGSS